MNLKTQWLCVEQKLEDEKLINFLGKDRVVINEITRDELEKIINENDSNIFLENEKELSIKNEVVAIVNEDKENDMINISGHTFTHTCLFLPVFFRNFSSNHNTAKSQNIYDTLHKYSWLLSNAGQASILFIISAYIPVPTATTCIES